MPGVSIGQMKYEIPCCLPCPSSRDAGLVRAMRMP